MPVLPLTKPRFEALLYRRMPWTEMVTRELEWWSSGDETLIATLSLDLTDNDYSWIILGRDETGVFRGIDLSVSNPTIEEARIGLHAKLEEIAATHEQEFPQGDVERRKLEILVPHPDITANRLHPFFSYLMENPGYSPARGLIKEMSFTFTDLDGNYRKDFQTTGFNGRLWELYLYAFFYEQKFLIDNTHAVPDLIVEKAGFRIAVEATTLNPPQGNPAPMPKTPEEEKAFNQDAMPMKWSRALTTKLGKRYWEQENIANCPLVFAVHDYHAPGSMCWSLPGLSDYLFGVRCDDDGNDHRIETHSMGDAVIQSGFFRLTDSENISAVIVSNEATLPKFNRIGKIAGFGDPSIRIRRFGARLNLETLRGERFESETQVGVVDDSWSRGIWVFHNPNAKHPIHPALFEDALHVICEDGQREYYSTRPKHVIRSTTQIDPPSA